MNELASVLWSTIVAISFVAWLVLDGIDIGMGCLHLFAKKPSQRERLLRVISPLWHVHSLWLVIAFGALFAGFPSAFSTLLSSSYLLVTFFLFAFILRIAAFSLRNKRASSSWKKWWDIVYFLSNSLLAFAVGYLVSPKNLSPFLFGAFAWVLFAFHGWMYLSFVNSSGTGLVVYRRHTKVGLCLSSLALSSLLVYPLLSFQPIAASCHALSILLIMCSLGLPPFLLFMFFLYKKIV